MEKLGTRHRISKVGRVGFRASIPGGARARSAIDTIRAQVGVLEEFRQRVVALLTPGTILVAISERSNASTRSATGFDILTKENVSQ